MENALFIGILFLVRQKKIEQAKLDWADGPGEAGSRFPKIIHDESEYIPLPNEKPSTEGPKGTIM